MYTICKHPILDIPQGKNISFLYEDKKIQSQKGLTIAAALHRAGYPVHSQSLKKRNRSLECGIGKCGACEMLVDDEIKRICITKVDNVKQVKKVPKDYIPKIDLENTFDLTKIYKTTVAIIGAGPAGLAAREELNNNNIDNIVLDNNEKIGGQFVMQTHQFFFFESKKKYGGMRGFDIANHLAGDNNDHILLNSTVWDILEKKRLAVKNLITREIYYVDADYLVVATGAIPFLPAFINDDVPGVYTAAVIQKMMNNEFTLLGKNVLTVGAGNIGYLTSYQLSQAGANVKAIIEAMPNEGGFPVQANRIRRLGIPIMLSHILLEAIPNKHNDGIIGAVIAKCENFKPISGTEKIIDNIDAINVCTGLISDDQLLIKGKEVFKRFCYAAGDAIRIGEGTSAVLRGKQAAYKIMQDMQKSYNYEKYLEVSKDYINSQQHPTKIIDTPILPDETRQNEKPFVVIDCLYGFACNPCIFSCKQNAISKPATDTVPKIDFNKCIGCLDCVWNCPGLAIFGFNLKKNWVFLPMEFDIPDLSSAEDSKVYLVDNNGKKIGEGILEKIVKKKNKTNLARVRYQKLDAENNVTDIRGYILLKDYRYKIQLKDLNKNQDQNQASESYICHCEDIDLDKVLKTIGNRTFVSVDEIKHTTRIGMGACRGKRCMIRLRQTLKPYNINIIGEPTPRGPLSNQISLGELYPKSISKNISSNTQIIPPKTVSKVKKVESFIAGGGIAGSALFRFLAEADKQPILINWEYGSSWRNIAGGRPVFSVPELSDIATQNLKLFEDLQKISNIDFRHIKYVTFAHDEATYQALYDSMAWQDSKMVEPKDFKSQISQYMNPNLKTYMAALVTKNCWQATPGKTIDILRKIGIENGGTIYENTKLIDVEKIGNIYKILVCDRNNNYTEYETEIFINALGANAEQFAKKLGITTNLFPVRHQAFITRRLPMLGINNEPLPMLIDRRAYKGFTAVYGQQLGETGQIIGCASPQNEHLETKQNLKINTQEFLESASEIFVNWVPELSSVGFQAVWSGYYIEPRMIIDPTIGLFVGLRGQGFMLGQYIAKLYVDKLLGKNVPDYFDRLKIDGDGLLEKAFK